MKKSKSGNWEIFLEIAKAAGILKNVQRTGWVLKGIKDVESVAEHSQRVAFLGMLLAAKFGHDTLRVLELSLIHDLGESGIGDIKWETGKIVIIPPDAKHKDEGTAMEKIFKQFDDGQTIIDLWREFTYQTTKEARFVKQLDKLEMAIQAFEYEAQGYESKLLDEFWENAEKYLAGQELGEIFEELKRERERISSNGKKLRSKSC